MSVAEEELAAYADGELEGEAKARVETAIEKDPALAEIVRRHRKLRGSLSAHFAPILDQPVPYRLRRSLQQSSEVVDFVAEKRKRGWSSAIPRWGWIAGPALAACLALVVIVPRSASPPDNYAGGQLAATLEEQLTATQNSDGDIRILLSFRRGGGDYCRAFASSGLSGIACRDAGGWELVEQMPGVEHSFTEFRQAGNIQGQLLERAQEMADGPALDARQERLAREANWR